jgi:hypothetical protein
MAIQFSKFLSFLKRKEKQIPTNQDALGAYPERIQISAIPERRYLRTTRVLAIFTFLNLAASLVLIGYCIYYAALSDVNINRHIYTIDPVYKRVYAAEYDKQKVSARELILEEAVSDYIKARTEVNMDINLQKKNIATVKKFMPEDENILKAYQKEANDLFNLARSKKVNKETYIYDIQKTPSGMWKAVIDVFDVQPESIFNPICSCKEVTRECIDCKIKNNRGRHRYWAFVRPYFMSVPSTLNNPFGIKIYDMYLLDKKIRPDDYWDTPSILKPEL